jgi:hypothetical protein
MSKILLSKFTSNEKIRNDVRLKEDRRMYNEKIKNNYNNSKLQTYKVKREKRF